MAQSNSDPVIPTPLEVKAGDREVSILEPEACVVTLTPDAAEISAFRLLDAAAKARDPSR